jgi:hypothetical protein
MPSLPIETKDWLWKMHLSWDSPAVWGETKYRLANRLACEAIKVNPAAAEM